MTTKLGIVVFDEAREHVHIGVWGGVEDEMGVRRWRVESGTAGDEEGDIVVKVVEGILNEV